MAVHDKLHTLHTFLHKAINADVVSRGTTQNYWTG